MKPPSHRGLLWVEGVQSQGTQITGSVCSMGALSCSGAGQEKHSVSLALEAHGVVEGQKGRGVCFFLGLVFWAPRHHTRVTLV